MTDMADQTDLAALLHKEMRRWHLADDDDTKGVTLADFLASRLIAAGVTLDPRPDSAADAFNTHHQPDTTCPICRYAQDHLAPRPDTALDVSRLVAAVHNWHNPSAAEFGSVCRPGGRCRADASAIAREYAALATDDPS